MKINPIIAALDVSNVAEALSLANRLKGLVGAVKVGSELFTIGGPGVVRCLVQKGMPVFLDLEFHDIPNTVAAAVRAASRLGVWAMNVHASGGLAMMQAAEQAAQSASGSSSAPVLVLGVTVLTSLDVDALHKVGITSTPAQQVERLTRLAMKAGLRGLVCSAEEVKAVRSIVPADFQLVVAGIRPAGVDKQDQKRTGTPKQAMQDGADWLVIGRPICAANDPRAAAQEILASLE